MCRQYSAETEKALKELIRCEGKEPAIIDNAEWLVLRSLLDDPYQLQVVRKAIRFYLFDALRPTSNIVQELVSQETH